MMGVALRGLSIGVVLVMILAALQLYDFGLENGWEFSSVAAFFASIDWASQWRKIAITFVESAAAAAAITIGLSVVVNNIFTTNISNQIINNVTEAINEKYVDALKSVNDSIAEQGARISAFDERLQAHRADDIALLSTFLEYARDGKIAELEGQLATDDGIFHRLGEFADNIKAATEEIKRARQSKAA